MTGTDQQLARIAEVQRHYTDMLMKKKHVVGTTIGPMSENGKIIGQFALIVLVDKKVSPDSLDKEDQIPAQLDGVPVIVHEVGALEAL